MTGKEGLTFSQGPSEAPPVTLDFPTEELEGPWQFAGSHVGWDFISCELRLLGDLTSPKTTSNRLRSSITTIASEYCMNRAQWVLL